MALGQQRVPSLPQFAFWNPSPQASQEEGTAEVVVDLHANWLPMTRS